MYFLYLLSVFLLYQSTVKIPTPATGCPAFQPFGASVSTDSSTLTIGPCTADQPCIASSGGSAFVYGTDITVNIIGGQTWATFGTTYTSFIYIDLDNGGALTVASNFSTACPLCVTVAGTTFPAAAVGVSAGSLPLWSVQVSNGFWVASSLSSFRNIIENRVICGIQTGCSNEPQK